MPGKTDHIDITTKAQVLLEALPYILRFRGSTFVVKYGGSFMDDPDPAVRIRVATDIVFLAAVGIHVVVVHGGGKAITRGMEEAGLDAVFRNGLRVTDEKTIEIVEKTLNNVVNLDICELVQARGGKPLGMHGNNVLVCEKLLSKDAEGEPVDLGYVGQIQYVKAKLIKKAIADGYTPIISPIAVDELGHPYNTNADVAAAAVASALRARRLVYLSDVPGLLRDPSDPSTLISSLHIDEVEALTKDGTISRGMLPKVNSAVGALHNGVHRVHFVDGRQPHSILLEIFTDKGIGTEIVNQ
ncbi:MAG: acetylglutamate kinase [Verrucomicrobiota bacterium JB024]|nr:acetylglutamate kinase [Verrucomicrobiota bacterium JB024]